MGKLSDLVSIVCHALHFELNFQLDDLLVKIWRQFSHLKIINLLLLILLILRKSCLLTTILVPSFVVEFIWIWLLLEWGAFLAGIRRSCKICARLSWHAQSRLLLYVPWNSSTRSASILSSGALIGHLFCVEGSTCWSSWKASFTSLGRIYVFGVLSVTLQLSFIFSWDARRTFYFLKEFSKLFHFFSICFKLSGWWGLCNFGYNLFGEQSKMWFWMDKIKFLYIKRASLVLLLI